MCGVAHGEEVRSMKRIKVIKRTVMWRLERSLRKALRWRSEDKRLIFIPGNTGRKGRRMRHAAFQALL